MKKYFLIPLLAICCISVVSVHAQHRKSPSLIFTIDTTRPKNMIIEYSTPYRKFSIIDSEYNEVRFKDSCGVWTIETKIDSAHLFRIMAYGMEMIFKSDSIANAIHYKSLDKAYNTANKWANLAEWICHDYGIDYGDLMRVLKKRGYKSVNLNNPHKSKAKL